MHRSIQFVFLSILLLGINVQAQQQQPNVLFIFCDDLNDVVIGGHPQCISPNIDHLAEMGVSFTNAHTNAPLCAPSRASMVTGLLPSSSGYFAGKQYHWRDNPNLKEAKTFMEHFKDNGYKVMGTGKIFHHKHEDHSVWSKENGERLFGYKYSFGPYPWDGESTNLWATQHPDFPTLHMDVLCTSLENVPDVKPDPGEGTPGFSGWRLYDKPFKYIDDTTRDKMPDELYADWAMEKLKEKHNQPFMMCIGFNRPHAPLIAPKKYFDMFPLESVQVAKAFPNDTADCAKILVRDTDYGTGRHGYDNYDDIRTLGKDGLKKWTQAYLACVAYVDEQIGKVLKALENSEYADNTIIVFSSDHGYHMGQKNWLFKNSLWGKATRIPYIIAGQGVQKNTTSNQAVSLVDIYPTLNDLCGLSKQPNINENILTLDGQSLVPILKGEKKSLKKDYTVTYVSSGKFAEEKGIPGDYQNHHAAIVSDKFRYIRCYNGEEELYDTEKDFEEINNLAANENYSKELKRFRKIYEGIKN